MFTQSPVWLQRGIHWERAPRDVNPKLSAGGATVLYFAMDGRFGMLSCTVYKQNGTISVSNGDSESIYRGKWAVAGNVVHVTYQLIRHDIRIIGEKLPGPEQTMDFIVKRNKGVLKVARWRGLNLEGFEYEVNPKLATSNLVSHLSFSDPVDPGLDGSGKPD
jgi:hypothetical protein